MRIIFVDTFNLTYIFSFFCLAPLLSKGGIALPGLSLQIVRCHHQSGHPTSAACHPGNQNHRGELRHVPAISALPTAMHYEAISDWTAPLSHASIDLEMAAASIFVMNLALQQRNPLIRDTMVAESFPKRIPTYSEQSLCFYPPKTSSKRHPVWKLCRFFGLMCFQQTFHTGFPSRRRRAQGAGK